MKPVFELIGGPQGSGKSSNFSIHTSGYDAFNVDEHRRRLSGGVAQNIPPAIREQATRDYQHFIEDHIARRVSFSIEVTLARDVTFEQAARARQNGFHVRLLFVSAALDDCILRVAGRVELGGHGVTAAVLAETYAASMKNLPRALAEFDLVQVYDNSAPGPAKALLALETQAGALTSRSATPPPWLRSALRGSRFDLA